jgi:hypothetical protein
MAAPHVLYTSKLYQKGLKKYKPPKKRISKRVGEILANPKIGDPIKAKSYKPMRHYHLDRNFVIFYVYCAEAREVRGATQCPWCMEECDNIGSNSIVLLNYGPHKILDNIHS